MVHSCTPTEVQIMPGLGKKVCFQYADTLGNITSLENGPVFNQPSRWNGPAKGQRSRVRKNCMFFFQLWKSGSPFEYVFRIWLASSMASGQLKKVFSKLEYKHRFLLWRYQSKYPVWEAPWFWFSFFYKVGRVPKKKIFGANIIFFRETSLEIQVQTNFKQDDPLLRVPWSER